MKFVGQKNQDEWVIKDVFDFRRGGFFVDLAAADGKSINNTLLLEKKLGWEGICIEAHPWYVQALRKNRKCIVVEKCVDCRAQRVEFRTDNGYGSGVVGDDTDNNLNIRREAIEYARKTKGIELMEAVTLEQILDDNNAPAIIDYLSFDVEGSETRIMRDFPFHKYRFLSMTIERPTVELNAKLFANGYAFVRNSDSMSNQRAYDSFYVHRSIPNFNEIEKMPFVQIPAKDW